MVSDRFGLGQDVHPFFNQHILPLVRRYLGHQLGIDDASNAHDLPPGGLTKRIEGRVRWRIRHNRVGEFRFLMNRNLIPFRYHVHDSNLKARCHLMVK